MVNNAIASLLLCVAGCQYVSSASISARATDSTTVDLNTCSGTPQLFGQGLLYGLSGTNTPPQKFFQDLKINYVSAGGAQTDKSPAGYAHSMASYNYRFSTVVDYWRRIRQNNGVMIIKMADLWGADETTNNQFPFPGDNGNWQTYDAFIQQVIKDVKANGMANSYTTQLELWNEPDINFGGRPQSQYNQMFVRGVKALRKAFPSSSNAYLPLVGPSTAARPGENDAGWWDPFVKYLQANGGKAVQLDVWNWHQEENNNNDPIPPAQHLPGYLNQHGLDTGIGLQNNEYGIRSQQVPSYNVWFKARYERLKFNGLRGNWEGGAALNDYMADLLLKNSDGSYSTNGEYQAYKFYGDMTGSPCTTTSGSSIDSYATASTNNATALVGSQFFKGTANVNFSNISKQFGTAKTLKATIYNIPYNNGGAVSGWTVSKTQTVNVANDKVTVSFNSGNGNDAWAVNLSK